MRSRSIDQGLILLGVMLLLISSYQLFFHQEGAAQSKVLGKLTTARSVVKTKNALTLDWRDAHSGNDVAENQLIYTDQKSSAEVIFERGDQLSIGENSLIKISSVGSDTTLDVERGIIRAKLEGDKPMMVEMNGRELYLTGPGAEVQINLNDQKGEIGVISGKVKVEAEGESSSLSPEVSMAINGKDLKTRKIYFTALAPTRDQTIYTTDATTTVTFNWGPNEVANVILSSSAHMDKAQSFELSPGEVIELGIGTHYWKLESEKGPSIVNSFRIHQELAPKILRPLSGEKIILPKEEGKQTELLLQWESEPQTEYLLEWEQESRHSQVFTSGTGLINVSESGPIKWRVKIQDEKRTLAQWSQWQKLELLLLAPPALPRNLSPEHVEFQTYQKPEENVELSWTSALPVELEILKPNGIKEILSLIENTHQYLAQGAGLHRWRLRSMDSYGRTSDWTEWMSFEITDHSQTREAGIQRIQLKKPDQLVKFDWEAPEGAVSVFELSQDAKFEKLITKKEVKTNSIQVAVPKVGEYFWRSRQFLPDGKVNTSEPVRVIIEQTPLPKKPMKLPDMEVPIEWKSSSAQNLFHKILGLIISSAHADEVKSVVKLTLPYEEEAKGFHIKIFQDKALTKIILDRVISSKTFEWVGVEPGIYYWQYAVIDFWERQSPYSDPAVLTVTGVVELPPEQPRLLQPIRAVEVENKELVFKWTKSPSATRYIFQIATAPEFTKPIFEATTQNEGLSLAELDSPPGLHYWRLKAVNRVGMETLSNSGRFITKPPLEKIIIADQHAKPVWKKNWRSRASISWAPSKDEYTFKQNDLSGKISGQALMGIEAKGTFFFEKYTLNTEILRQMGKVFESQDYLFGRISVDITKNYFFKSGSRWNIGAVIAQTSSQEFVIEDDVVKGSAISALGYGPIFRSYHAINEWWELQTKAFYLFGDITQMEAGLDVMRAWKKDWFYLGGVSYGLREYGTGAGEQSSLKINFGVGSEF